MGNELNKNLKFLFKNTATVFIIKVIGLGIGFFFQVYLGNVMGASNYGKYSLFLTMINLIGLITVFGMDNSLIRTLPRTKEKWKKNLLKKTLLTTVIIFILLVVSSIIFPKQVIKWLGLANEDYLKYFLIALFITSISKIFDGIFQGEKKTVIVNIFSAFLSNAIKFILFFMSLKKSNDNLFIAINVYLFSEILLLITRFLYYKKKINKEIEEERYPSSDFKRFLRYSISLCAISGVSIFVHSIDKIMINSMIDSYNVGLYRVSENYLNLVGIFVSPFVVFWPMISTMYKENKIEMLNEIFGYITKIIALIAIPMVIFMVVFSKDLVAFFGKQYMEGSNILFILLIGNLFDSLTGPVGALLNMTDYAKYNLIDMIILAMMNLVLNYFLIPKYGAAGAAMATTICVIIINIVNIIQNKMFLNVFPYDMKNIYIVLSSLVLYLIDYKLYSLLNMNILIKMVVTLAISYVAYFIIFTIIVRPNYKKMLSIMKGDRNE